MKIAKITTILPTFQRPRLLRRAIESVLQQTVSDFVLCIYDNNSQDETAQVVGEYQKMDSRIRYYQRETNIGPLENFASALACVDTPYFSFLSDDDYLLPKFYETTLQGFKEHPEAGFSAGRTLISNAKGKFSRAQFLHPFLNGYFPAGLGINLLLSPHCFPVWTGILFKSAILNQIGGIDRKAGYTIDMEFTLRYASFSSFVIRPKPVAVLMKWKQAFSTIPVNIHETNLDILIGNVIKYFKGTPEELHRTSEKLHLMKVRALKHIWIHSLLANQIENASEARVAFLKGNGSINRWKLKLLELTEKNSIFRKLFHIYYYLKIFLSNLNAYFRRIDDPELNEWK